MFKHRYLQMCDIKMNNISFHLLALVWSTKYVYLIDHIIIRLYTYIRYAKLSIKEIRAL